MHNKVYQFKNGQILISDDARFDLNKTPDDSIFLYSMVCDNRTKAVTKLKQIGVPTDVCEKLLSPEDNIRFKYYSDFLYGELSYYSITSFQPYYAAMIIYKNIMISVYEERLGIGEELIETFTELNKEQKERFSLEFALYTFTLELLSYNAKIILDFREDIEKLSKKILIKKEDVSPEDFLHAKNRLSDFSMVIEHLFYSMSFPPTKELLNLESTFRVYFSDLAKSMDLLKSSLKHAEEKLDWLTDHFELLQQEKSNKRLKFLTITQAVFVPLTLIAGIYGMNFKVMPELEFQNGYFIVLGVMAVTALLVLGYFYKNKWFE